MLKVVFWWILADTFGFHFEVTRRTHFCVTLVVNQIQDRKVDNILITTNFTFNQVKTFVTRILRSLGSQGM